MNIEIVYQDNDILAINKPPGLVVNRAQTVKGITLQDWLEENIPMIGNKSWPEGWEKQIPEDHTNEYGTPEEVFASRSGIAHRLDKDTSGVMLIAKHPGSLINLLKQFRERVVQKKYTCLTHGKFALEKSEVNLPIGRRSKNRKLFGIVAGGRSAVTLYEVEQFYPEFDVKKVEEETGQKNKRYSLYQGFSLVNCWPKTGRTHQIRVHMAYLKHPIVGDQSYVGKKRSKLDFPWCTRQFLHARSIQFTHPNLGEKVEYEAPLSTDLLKALTYLS